MRVPLVDFDYRLVVLSSFTVIIATYATLAVVERMKFAQGTGWFAWLGGGASGIGIGIWSMHYLGLQTLSLSVPMLNCSSVVYSILATIFASGITLLVIGKSDSGRSIKEKNQRSMRLEISSTTEGPDYLTITRTGGSPRGQSAVLQTTFDVSEPVHRQSSITKGHSIRWHLAICTRAHSGRSKHPRNSFEIT
jgi:Bacterial signalling protein N terminal repeat